MKISAVNYKKHLPLPHKKQTSLYKWPTQLLPAQTAFMKPKICSEFWGSKGLNVHFRYIIRTMLLLLLLLTFILLFPSSCNCILLINSTCMCCFRIRATQYLAHHIDDIRWRPWFQGSGGQWPASHSKGLGSLTVQSSPVHVWFLAQSVGLGYFFTKNFRIPLSVSTHQCSTDFYNVSYWKRR